MKTKHFRKCEQALDFAHKMQLGGFDVSVIIRAEQYTVCETKYESEFYTNTVSIERMRASADDGRYGTESYRQ